MILESVLRRPPLLLRDVGESDASTYWQWYSDPLVREFLLRRETTVGEHVEDLRACRSSEKTLALGVEYRGRGLVGDVRFSHIDFVARRAEVGVLIGDRGLWGKGVAKLSLLLLMKEVGPMIGVVHFIAKIDARNVRSVGLFTKLGFVHDPSVPPVEYPDRGVVLGHYALS